MRMFWNHTLKDGSQGFSPRRVACEGSQGNQDRRQREGKEQRLKTVQVLDSLTLEDPTSLDALSKFWDHAVL